MVYKLPEGKYEFPEKIQTNKEINEFTKCLSEQRKLSLMPDYVEYLGEYNGHQYVAEASYLVGGTALMDISVMKYNSKGKGTEIDYWRSTKREVDAVNILRHLNPSKIENELKELERKSAETSSNSLKKIVKERERNSRLRDKELAKPSWSDVF